MQSKLCWEGNFAKKLTPLYFVDLVFYTEADKVTGQNKETKQQIKIYVYFCKQTGEEQRRNL